MGCAFCASTIAGKVRDLTPAELLDQVIFTQKDSGLLISNIVLMGIGEPMDNLDNVLKFLELVNHPDGLNIGMRHISLSTCGVIPGIQRLADLGLQLTLSVSLHAPDDETRSKIMPECVVLLAETEPELLETRALNPRKVFTHCKLVTRLTGYRRTATEFCTDAEAERALCIQKRQEVQHTTALTHIVEKDFTFSDELDLSPGRAGAAEILSSRVCSSVTEAKVVGSKLILKGLFTVTLLYRSPEGKCCSTSGELPFSQIMTAEPKFVPEEAVQVQLPDGAAFSVRLIDCVGYMESLPPL